MKQNYVFVASCSQLKTETDSRDITGHPHDDKTRSYLCTVCHKRFTTKSHLTRHSNRHTVENEYSCTQCEKHFSSQSGLQNHMNIHAGKHKCTECGKCCTTRQNLAVHRRSHSGEKPFECTVANDLQHHVTLLDTVEFTVVRNRTNVTCVRKHLVVLTICTVT